MGNLGFEDRRIFLRFPASLPLHYININLNLKRKSQAQTCNISANGIGLVTNEELLPRTPLDIWLNIPDNGQPLNAKAEVVWAKKIKPNRYVIGVSLENVELMGMSRILSLDRALRDGSAIKSCKIKRWFLEKLLKTLL